MRRIVRYSPMTTVNELQREVDRLFSDFLPSSKAEGETAVWAPRADVSENEDEYRVVLELPGINKEEVDITFEDGTLRISGERTIEKSESGLQYHTIERSYGRFFRSFYFGEHVDSNKFKAEFNDGILTIHAAKAVEKKPLKINVS